MYRHVHRQRGLRSLCQKPLYRLYIGSTSALHRLYIGSTSAPPPACPTHDTDLRGWPRGRGSKIYSVEPLPKLCSRPWPPNTSWVTVSWLRVAQRNFATFRFSNRIRDARVMIELRTARRAIFVSVARLRLIDTRGQIRTWSAAAASALCGRERCRPLTHGMI